MISWMFVNEISAPFSIGFVWIQKGFITFSFWLNRGCLELKIQS